MPSGVLVDLDHLGATFIPKWVLATLIPRSLKCLGCLEDTPTNQMSFCIKNMLSFEAFSVPYLCLTLC
jgi:hypothetical protein